MSLTKNKGKSNVPVKSKKVNVVNNNTAKKTITDTPKNTKTPQQKKKNISPELEKTIAGINKKFGENAVTIGFPRNDDGSIRTIERIPTGSFTLDVALGGGLPLGRFIEISGAYSSTKTTQCLHIIAEAQKRGFVCALLDVEGTTDEEFAKSVGVDFDSLIYMQPGGMEEGLEVLLQLQKSGEVQLGVIDSIAALSPNKEQDTTIEETVQMGITPKLLGEYFRKYYMNNNKLVRNGKRPFTTIGINQLREKIGSYGDPEYTPGGRAKGFASTIELRLRRGDWISEGTGDNKEIVGQVVKFKVEKNKTYKRMQTGEFDFYFSGDNNAGVSEFHSDVNKEVIISAVERGIIERGGAWYVYKDIKCQGLNALVEELKNDENLLEEVKREVLKTIKFKKGVDV